MYLKYVFVDSHASNEVEPDQYTQINSNSYASHESAGLSNQSYPGGTLSRREGFGVRDIISMVMSNGDLIQQVLGMVSGSNANAKDRPATPQERFSAIRSILSALLGLFIRLTFLFTFGQEYVQVCIQLILINAI